MRPVYFALALTGMLLGSSSLDAAWQVRTYQQSGTFVTNLSVVDNLIAANAVVGTASQFVMDNYDAGGGGSTGRFNVDLVIPGLPSSDNNDFAVRGTGILNIVTADNYLFGVNSDDGSRLRIDGVDVILDDTQHVAQDVSANIFLTAGAHTIDFVWFEQAIFATGELFAIRGNFASLNDIPPELLPNLVLVGDTANGGLEVTQSASVVTPEPASLTLLAIGAAGACGWRVRRRAAG